MGLPDAYPSMRSSCDCQSQYEGLIGAAGEDHAQALGSWGIAFAHQCVGISMSVGACLSDICGEDPNASRISLPLRRFFRNHLFDRQVKKDRLHRSGGLLPYVT